MPSLDAPVRRRPPGDLLPDVPLPGPDTLRAAGWFLLGASGVTAVVLALPQPALGWRVTGLVLAFHAAWLVGALRPGREWWWACWAVLAPLSVLMVLPDWFLSAELGTLVFPDTGGPRLDTVPVFMAGMWTLALVPLVVLGTAVERRAGATRALAAVAVAGLALFWAAEALAPLVPLWEPVDVRLVAGVAVYVLPAEVVLSVAAWVLVRGASTRPRAWTAVGVALLPMVYLGMLATGYQLLG